MAVGFPALFEAATRRLGHDHVTRGDTVLIVTDDGTHAPLRDAVYAAAVATGADVTVLMFRASEQPFADIPPLVEEAIKSADYTFTLLSQVWFYNASSERVRGHMRRTGKRMSGWEGIEDAVGHFVALLPGDQMVVERTNRMAELLLRAKIIRITSRIGTDLTMERGDPRKQLMNNLVGQVNYSPLTIESRMAIAQGVLAPPKETCAGTVMFQGAYRTHCPGPGIHKGLVHQPVRIEIEHGRIVDIARDTEHGIFLHDWFHAWQDPTVFYIDHLNVGLDHRVRLEYLDNLAVHFNYGGLLMGFGICFSSNRGDLGAFRAKAHIELHLTGANLFFDERQILSDGEFTKESGVPVADRRPGTPSPFMTVDGHVLPAPPEL